MLEKNTSVFLIKNDEGLFELRGIRLTRGSVNTKFRKQEYLVSVLSDDLGRAIKYAKGYATKNGLYLKSTHLNYV